MKKLPVDVSSFKHMITEDYLYIDKTEYIYNLVTKGRFYFLSRPRRFGKSLLISTLKELFSNNRSLFTNLWIDKSDYAWQEFPVINLNFSFLSIENSHELKISLEWALDSIAIEFGIDVSKAPSPGLKLEMLVKALSQKNKVVILVDEYDYPLINAIENKKVAEANRKVLKNLFSAIKGLDEYLRAIFITGVSKFSKTSIFSGLNNLDDLSLDPLADCLLGYTPQELNHYFSTHIQELAKTENQPIATIQLEIQRWYNGYRFSKDPSTVYNPFSVLYCLKKKNFENYWFESGTPSFLIELLKQNYSSLEFIEQIELSSDSLGTFDVGHLPIIPILFQTGYLTIHDYDKVTKKYKLGYPNYEVKESFKKYLLAAGTHSDIPTVESTVSQLSFALNTDNIELFCSLLKSLFAHIPYHLHIPQERYYHSLIQLLASLLGLEAQSEIVTDKGRIDFVITTKAYVYIFEFKFAQDADRALKQIDTRKYYERYETSKKNIVLIGLSFNKGKKGLTIEYKIEDHKQLI